MLSFRFAGTFLLGLGAHTLCALRFHPPQHMTVWFDLALACRAWSRPRETTESNSTKYALSQAAGTGL